MLLLEDLSGFSTQQKKEPEELGFQLSEVKEACKVDMDFFSSVALPETTLYAYPPVFKALWSLCIEKLYQERDFSKVALGLPRGMGKTTVVKLLCLYAILFTNKKFILITCAKASLAENIISGICDMLDSPNIKAVFGNWEFGKIKDTADIKIFSFLGKDITLAAAGAGTSIRGLLVKNARPDFIVFDDIQKKEDYQNKELTKDLLEWMTGSAMKARSPYGCFYLYIGNMYPELPSHKCILQTLQENKEWISFIVGAILANKESIWEELHPLSQLLKEFEADTSMGLQHVFISEMLNDPKASASGYFDVSKVPSSPYQDGELAKHATGKYIIIDPSGSTESSDTTVIGLFYLIDGVSYFVKKKRGHFSPKETIEETIKLALDEQVPLICVENVAYQASLLFWFSEIANSLGIEGIQFLPLSPKRQAKSTRIIQLFKRLQNGELYLSEEERPDVLYEASLFRPDKKNNVDDLLDVLAYSENVEILYGQEALLPLSLEVQDWASESIDEENWAF